MSEEIKYGFPKIKKNNEPVGFKTYTTCVYDMNGNTLEDRLLKLSSDYNNITDTGINEHNLGYINAVAAGIDNTGKIDVYKPLQKLIDKYKCVYLPAGTYKVSHYIRLWTGSILEGESINTTFIKMVSMSNADSDDISSTLRCEDSSNIIIKNISIVGQNKPENEKAIFIYGCFKNVNLSNINIYDFCDKGIHIDSNADTGGSNCNLDNVRIIQNLTKYIGVPTYKTGKCIDIELNNKKDFVNINNLVCTSNEYINNTFTNDYLGNFVKRNTDKTLTYDPVNKVPIIIGINIVGTVNLNDSIKTASIITDKSPSIHISNSIFEGMTECIHCKWASVSMLNCAFNLSIVGALLADSYSNCQIIGCTFLTLYDYKSEFGYDLKRKLLNDKYNLKIYNKSGTEITSTDASNNDPQPLARLEIYNICGEEKIYKHPYILLLLTIGDMRVFINETYKNSAASKFENSKLVVVGRGVSLVYGEMTITDS